MLRILTTTTSGSCGDANRTRLVMRSSLRHNNLLPTRRRTPNPQPHNHFPYLNSTTKITRNRLHRTYIIFSCKGMPSGIRGWRCSNIPASLFPHWKRMNNFPTKFHNLNDRNVLSTAISAYITTTAFFSKTTKRDLDTRDTGRAVSDDDVQYDQIQVQLVVVDRTAVPTNTKYHNQPPLRQQPTIHLSYTKTSATTTDTDTTKSRLSVVLYPAWLWCNDPTFIHEASGQHLRTHRLTKYYYQHNIQIHAVHIIPSSDGAICTSAHNNNNNNNGALQQQQQHTPIIPIPSPSPGSLHPRHVYTTNGTTSQQTTRSILHVVWTYESSQQSHHIDSYYDVAWLIRCHQNVDDHHTKAKTQTQKEPQPDECVSIDVTGRHHTINSDSDYIKPVVIPTYNYNEFNNDSISDETVNGQSIQLSNFESYKILNDVFHCGAVLIHHVPLPIDQSYDDALLHDENSPVAIFGKTLSGGRLSHGQLYGDVFHVRDKTKQSIDLTSDDNFTATTNSEASDNNIAYTTLALCPHQDLAYYESIPGLQLLHCIENDINTIQGGASTLIDVISAASKFQKLAPDLFDVLEYCEATFLKQRDGADMIYRRPHFQCSMSDKQIISVRWSPPFEGPLLLSANLQSHLVEDYYVAYSAFERMIDNALPRLHKTKDHTTENRLLPHISYELEDELCHYAKSNTWENRMQRGDLLIFNNQRMLHGRRAYTFMSPPTNAPTCAKGSTGRHLMGCYTNIDDTLSQYRLLRRNYYHKQYELPFVPMIGNGSNCAP